MDDRARPLPQADAAAGLVAALTYMTNELESLPRALVVMGAHPAARAIESIRRVGLAALHTYSVSGKPLP